MAADMSELEDFCGDTLVLKIVRIQAFIRGCIVRKQMKEIQKLYEEIVKDIDGPEMEVVWSPDYVSVPKVRKGRKIESAVVEPSITKNNINQSAYQNTYHFGSSRKKQTSALVGQPAQVLTDKNMTEVTLVKHGLVSTEVQTEPSIGVPQMFGVSTEFSSKNNRTSPSIHSDNKLISPTDKVCSQAQKVGPNLFSSVLHKNSDSVKTSEVGHMSSDMTNRSWQSFTSGETTSPSRHDVVPEKLICEDVSNKNSSQKIEPEKLVHTTVDKPIPGSQDKGSQRHRSQGGKEEIVSNIKSGVDGDVEVPFDKEQLLQLKNTVAMELLWVQQAINSRKHYLKLKEQLQ